MNRWQASHEHRRLAKQSALPSAASTESDRQRVPQRRARHQRHAREGEEGSPERGQSQALLSLGSCEQERHERYEREQDLAEARVQLDERVVGERVRRAELKEAEDESAGECPSAGNRKPQRHHEDRKERRREREAQPRAPERIELAVREPDADRVAAGEDGARSRRRPA